MSTFSILQQPGLVRESLTQGICGKFSLEFTIGRPHGLTAKVRKFELSISLAAEPKNIRLIIVN